MKSWWRSLGLGLVLLLCACGGDKPKAVSVGSGPTVNRLHGAVAGSGSKTTKDAGTATTGADAGTINLPGSPLVKFVSPTNTTDPNKDEIITSKTLKVQCQVQRSTKSGAREVNQSSVRIKLIPIDDPKMAVTGTIMALADNIFEAEFNLASVPNGTLHFECDADDTGMPALKGLDSLDTFLDLGPTITIVEPHDMGRYALKTPVLVKFQVSAAPLSDGDKEATPTEVTLDVSGQAFKFAEDPAQPGLYTTSVDFNDKTLFPMQPIAAQVVVSAKSSRTPTPPTASVKVDIELDSSGPSITVKSPADSTIVRGNVTLIVEITDPSGVKMDSVVGTINQTLHTLNNWTISGTTYTEVFDTRKFGTDLTQLTINITASDSVGNESTRSHILRLDNLPPIISLDPPFYREYMQASPSVPLVCSVAFDPVGDRATNDGQMVPVSSLYRAMLWDRTNGSVGANFSYYAGIDPMSVVLFAQRDPAVPLLIDTDGDQLCDEINIKGDPAGPMPEQLSLSPVTSTGNAYYSVTPNFSDPRNDVSGTSCTAGTATMPPAYQCPASDMFRVITGPGEDKPSAIYALRPANGSLGACDGNTWELGGVVGEGWKCLAVRAEDTIHNVGISRPLRVCISDGSGPVPCDPATDTLPTCTDGCILPAEFPPQLRKAQ
jgi:hypothetical protein